MTTTAAVVATSYNIEPISVAELQELLSTPETCSAEGPVELLAELLKMAAAHTDAGTIEEAMEYVASKGLAWNGGSDGAIGVNVRDFGDGEPECSWTSTGDATWCTLRELVNAVRDGNSVPDWYDQGWIAVQASPGKWVARDSIAAGYLN